jgi:hypothetical protein
MLDEVHDMCFGVAVCPQEFHLYCMQTEAIQQYTLHPWLCLPAADLVSAGNISEACWHCVNLKLLGVK